ncbi:hypothetical protein KoxyNG13_003630 [Klebsiella pasteurii]
MAPAAQSSKGETAGRSPGGVTMLTRLLFALLTLLLLAIPVVQQGIAQGLNGRFSFALLF